MYINSPEDLLLVLFNTIIYIMYYYTHYWFAK